MRIKKFLDEVNTAVPLATGLMKNPVRAEVIVRLENGKEFSPAKVKVTRGKIIICESEFN
jgi:NifB/MoaA-like Fe-S oxidoreductase